MPTPWSLPLALALATAVAASAGAAASSGPTALVQLTRSGGLTGAVERLVVRRDGQVSASPPGRTIRVAPRELARVRRELRAARLPDLPRDAGAPGVPDGVEEELRSDGAVVRLVPGSVPQRVRPLLAHLRILLRRAHG